MWRLNRNTTGLRVWADWACANSARTLIADSADKIGAESKGESVPELIDGPAAIAHMVDALNRLADELPAG